MRWKSAFNSRITLAPSDYNICLSRNKWRSRHRTLRLTASTVQFIHFNERITSITRSCTNSHATEVYTCGTPAWFRLLSLVPLCGRKTNVPATHSHVAWQDTRSTYVTGYAWISTMDLSTSYCLYSFSTLLWLVWTLSEHCVPPMVRPQERAPAAGGEQPLLGHSVAQPLTVSPQRFLATQWPGSRRQWVAHVKAALAAFRPHYPDQWTWQGHVAWPGRLSGLTHAHC